MFHEITDAQVLKKRKVRIALVCIVLVLALAAWMIFGTLKANAREQGAVALQNSIVDAAKQCCAIEGSYPSSIEHLEQYYGLSVNHEDYVISYESFAGNVMPTVVVTPK
jgi:hypothetical protein